MKLLELIDRLRVLHDEFCGDADVHIDDADTNWTLAIIDVDFDYVENCVLLRGDYHETANPPRKHHP